MKRKKLLQLFSVALLGATILTGVNALPANSASSKALSNANTSSIESTTLSDASTEVNDSETAENTSSKDAESNNEEKSTTNVKDSESVNTETKETLSKENEAVHNGWVKNEDGTWNLYKDGKKVTGVYNPGPGTIYSFDENGACRTGWTEINGKTYYFKETSTKVVAACNEVIDGRHLDGMGAIRTGLHSAGPNTTYGYDENGYECKGLTKINGKMYYFKETSYGYTMVTNTTIDGNYFNKDGVCEELSDATTPDQTPAIKDGWENNADGNTYYYENGKMITSGFYTPGPGGTYYFYESGASAKGWTEIDGKMYYFKAIDNGYVMACNTVVDGRFLDANGVCDDTKTVKVSNTEDAIKLIKENDSTYLDSLEKELGRLNLVNSGLNYNTGSYIHSDSKLFSEPIYKILVIQNDTFKTVGEYFVGSVSGKVYSYKTNFKLVYEMKNNEIVSTAYRNAGPMGDYDNAAWR